MALNKKTETKPAFEDTGDTTVADSAPSVNSQATADVAATTAVATAAASSKTAVATVTPYVDVFKQYLDAIPAVGFGTLPRVVASQGAIIAKLNGGKEVDLGKKIGLELLSFRSQWTISPGDDSADAKEFVEYSNDGVTIDRNGKNVNEYIAQLRDTEGYPKADKKRYVYLTGVLTDADAPELVDQIVEVSLSPQAVTDFDGFRLQRSHAISRGKADANSAAQLVITADKRAGNGKNWTTLVVSGK